MSYLVVNTKTWKIRRITSTEAGAKRALTAMKKRRSALPEDAVMSYQDFKAGDILVPVKNRMTGAEVMIPRSDVGSCCDPSTERYWSM